MIKDLTNSLVRFLGNDAKKHADNARRYLSDAKLRTELARIASNHKMNPKFDADLAEKALRKAADEIKKLK